MGDYYSEYIVKRKTPGKDKAIGALIIVADVIFTLVCLYSMLFIPYAGFFLMVIAYFFSWLYFRTIDVEWEYTLVEKSRYVEKIMQKAKRKRMAEYDLSKVEMIAPVSSYHIKEYDKRNLKVLDFTSLEPDRNIFAMIILNNNEMVKVLFEPSERMLKEMRNVAPRQLHIE